MYKFCFSFLHKPHKKVKIFLTKNSSNNATHETHQQQYTCNNSNTREFIYYHSARLFEMLHILYRLYITFDRRHSQCGDVDSKAPSNYRNFQASAILKYVAVISQ